MGGELGDVRPGDEGLLPLAAQDDDAHLVIHRELPGRRGNLTPHVDGDGIPPFRMIENDPGDRTFPECPDVSTHGCENTRFR
jgi:hypothetical protein